MKLNIPRASGCNQLTFTWPKLLEYNGENCFCLTYETLVYSFRNCQQSCGTDYDFQLLGDSVIFNSRISTDILVHFLCDEHPCVAASPCAMESILASYRLIVGAEINTDSCENNQADTILGLRVSVGVTTSLLGLMGLILLYICYRRVYCREK